MLSDQREERQMPNYTVIPSLRVRDMKPALDFYTNVLGFVIQRGTADEDNVSLNRGEAHFMIERPGTFYSEAYNAAIRERMGGLSPHAIYVEAPDLEELHGKLVAAGAKVLDPLATRPWGQAEFTVEDPDGNWLTFWKATAS